jgi:hypothetical protein
VGRANLGAGEPAWRAGHARACGYLALVPSPAQDVTAAALARFREFYGTFSAAWLPRLDELYAPGFRFRDPFHAIDGDLPALRAYLGRVLTAVAESRFVIEDTALGADGAYVRWRWEWRRRARDPQRIAPGISHLRLAADGRITHHHDLFDAAEGVYEALPVLGPVLRAIKRRI